MFRFASLRISSASLLSCIINTLAVVLLLRPRGTIWAKNQNRQHYNKKGILLKQKPVNNMSKINAVKNEMVLGMGNKTFCFKSTYTISIAGPGLYLNQFWWRAVNQFFFVQQRREYQQNYSCLIMGPSLLKCKLKAQCILKSVLGGTVYFKICAGRHSVF